MSQWYADHALNLVTYLPLAGALALLLIDKKNKRLIIHAATWIALADFLLSVPLFFMYDAGLGGFQFENRASWIPSIGVQYHVGLDGISLLLLLLTTLLGFISILSSWTAITERVKEYYIFMLLLQTGMLGVFVSLDLFLFYIFWEAMLVPMYFLIGIWGGPRKLYAAIKCFLYTLIGSVLMLLGILRKMGTYGFVRFSLPMLPYATKYYLPWLLALSVIGIIYGALVAMVQKDWKKLVAYSSVSHLGFCMLGVFALNQPGLNGGILQMINHGLSTGALFLIVGLIYERRHTRMISDYGGLSKQMPVYATLFMIITMSSIGLPTLNSVARSEEHTSELQSRLHLVCRLLLE